MSYIAPIYTGVVNGGTSTTYVTGPVVGEVRYDTDKDTMQTWTGQDWVTLYGHKETVYETVQESIDRIAVDISMEYQGNATVEDAFKEWEEASKKLQVVLALAGKK